MISIPAKSRSQREVERIPMPSIYNFPTAIILKVTGKDATRYLNARLSNDIKKLNNNARISAACLTANGRTLGLFEVAKINEEYLLFCTGGDNEKVVKAVKQFIVADRVTVDVLDNYQAFHFFDTKSELEELLSLSIDQSVFHNEEIVIFDNKRIGPVGFDILVDGKSKVAKLLSTSTNLISHTDYDFLRISNHTLSFPEEINEELLFAESGLTKAVAFNKGCYVGQEVIEMIDARGSLPYVIMQFEYNSLDKIEPEQQIYEDQEQSKKIGTVISSAQCVEMKKTVGFARIKNQAGLSNYVFTNGVKLQLNSI